MRPTTDTGNALTRRQRGFTLVEAIIVIVITGIIAGMVAIFIRMPVRSQVDTQARADVADAADLALRRMTRELRLALPHTVTVFTNPVAIQFLLTKAGGRYIDVNDRPPDTLLPLDFSGASNAFDMVGTAPAGRQAIVAGDYIAIANTDALPAYAWAFDGTADNVSQVAAVNGSRITLQANKFRTTVSPSQSFQVVTGTVTYVCTPAANGAGTLQRYFTRRIVPGVGNMAGLNDTATPPILTTMVSGCSFSNNPLRGQNAGSLMTLVLMLQHANGERAQLSRQTQLDNP